MTNFVYMTYPETKGAQYVPDDPAAITFQEARGWKVSTPPEEKPFVPENISLPEYDDFITMYHPGVDAHHEFPANTEAIVGAIDSGWQLMSPADLDPITESPSGESVKEPEPKTKRSVKPQTAKEEKGVTDNG